MNSSTDKRGLLSSVALIRFGDFEYDVARHELRKQEIRLRLQKQPLEILLDLIESPGKLVTREALRRRLWSSGTYVAFEQGLNSAMNRLRDALCDSAQAPRFIETVPGEGYRFIAPIETIAAQHHSKSAIPVPGISAAATEAGPTRKWSASAPAIAAVAILCVALGAVALLTPRPQTAAPKSRQWVLVTNFENRTGNQQLDNVVGFALQNELTNSQQVRIASPERIKDALSLMRKAPDSVIDEKTGREICLRDPDIRVLITGHVSKLGSAYALEVASIDPADGRILRGFTEQAKDENQILSAVHRLGDALRESLGESLAQIRQAAPRFELVTTPSFHALRLYTDADGLIRRGRSNSAAELLEQSLAEDSNFASARLLLGYVYTDRGDQAAGTHQFELAFQLANTTSERERYFIEATYEGEVLKDPERSAATYERLLSLYPDHYWALNNLVYEYRRLGRIREAVPLIARIADSRPNDLVSNADAVWARAMCARDFDGALPYLERCKALIDTSDGNTPQYAYVVTWVRLFPAFQQWISGNIEESHRELIAEENLGGILEPTLVAQFHMAFGEFGEAERWFWKDQDPQDKEQCLAILAFAKGDMPAVKTHLLRAQAAPGPGVVGNSTAALLMTKVGLRSVAERIGGQANFPRNHFLEGELALGRGDTARGISLLEHSIQIRKDLPTYASFVGIESLAEAYRKQSKMADVVRILEAGSSEKEMSYEFPGIATGLMASYWMRVELELADTYRSLGRLDLARKIEDELSKLLVFADPGHPIVRALQARGYFQNAGVVQ